LDDSRVRDVARREEGALLRYAYLLTGSRQDAEDLVQEAFAKVLRRKPGDISTMSAYLRRIILNDYRSLLRRAAAAPRIHPIDPPPFEDRVAVRESIWRGLQSLPKRQRAVLVLRYYEGLPDDEIAEILGCRRSTVRSLAARAFGSLRRHPALKPADGPAPAVGRTGR
jgi:RNA polymerase sigma factor (sigma-70 family)